MSILNQYSEAMMANDLDILIRIEKDNDVFGSNTDDKLEWPLSAEVIDDITKAL